MGFNHEPSVPPRIDEEQTRSIPKAYVPVHLEGNFELVDATLKSTLLQEIAEWVTAP